MTDYAFYILLGSGAGAIIVALALGLAGLRHVHYLTGGDVEAVAGTRQLDVSHHFAGVMACVGYDGPRRGFHSLE